jgi:hypothetical protein
MQRNDERERLWDIEEETRSAEIRACLDDEECCNDYLQRFA